MAQNDTLKRYLDAGMAFTQMTRDRAEAIVQELVKAGEVRRREAEKQIEELLERSRKNTDDLVAIIRREVADQLSNLGLDDLAKRAGVAKRGTAKKASAGSSSGSDPGATQTSAPVVAPPSAQKPAAKKAPAKAAAKKAPAKTPGKKAAAKKTAAKKA